MGMKPKASFKNWAFVAVDPFEDLLLGPTFGTAKVSEMRTAPFCCVVVIVVIVVVAVPLRRRLRRRLHAYLLSLTSVLLVNAGLMR